MAAIENPIAILGAGVWGTALAMHLSRNGSRVHLWDHDQARLTQLQQQRAAFDVPFSDQLIVSLKFSEAIKGVRDIGLVIPSHAFRAVLEQIKKIASPDVRLFWGTKGLDPAGALLHTVVADVFSPDLPAAVVSGPSFAKEVAMGLPTAVSVAGNNTIFINSLEKLFNSNTFHVYPEADWIGVQLCGVVKNVMAIAAGIADGQGLSTNTRCALITRGLSEMSTLIVAMGGQHETVMSLAGVGDLVLTATDNQSRNRRFGLAIGQGASAEQALKDIGQSVEGYYNTQQLHALALKYNVAMPISAHVHAILYENYRTHGFFSEIL